MICSFLGVASISIAAPAPPNLPSLETVKPLTESGDRLAQHVLGLMYSEGWGVTADQAEAIKWFRLSAEQGDADSQFLLGETYYAGNGVRRDYAEAMKWFRLAATQGVAGAQFRLGYALQNGQGVSRNYEEAVKWYRLAAAQGVGAAQNNLGVMYGRGQGVPRNDVYAYMWFLVGAAAEGAKEDRARMNKNQFSGLGTEQLSRAQAMAARCLETKYQECGDVMLSQSASFDSLKSSAEGGNAEAQFQLALALTNGLVVTKDEVEAATWYQKAADQGHKNAQFIVGTLYYSGKNVTQNHDEAFKWFRLAAEQGIAEAQATLGAMYQNGQGIAKDSMRAYLWLELAATGASGTETGRKAAEFRDTVAGLLTPAEITDAKAIAMRCRSSNYKTCN